MAQLLMEHVTKAKKDHDCMACEWLLAQGWDGMGFSRKDLRSISKAKKNNWLIKKGDMYTNQRCKQDGEVYTFKAITDIHKICLNHDLYEC